eukprot:scaffold104578_cov67-Attheya_sp.AAC.13
MLLSHNISRSLQNAPGIILTDMTHNADSLSFACHHVLQSSKQFRHDGAIRIDPFIAVIKIVFRNMDMMLRMGTSTETGVKSENHEPENILDFVDEVVLDTEFIDELDFDGDSIGTNPPDLDDSDIDLEESSI